MAESTTVSLPDIDSFKAKALSWANYFRVVCLLDSNNYPQKYSSKNWVLAVDAIQEVITQAHDGRDSLCQLKQFHERANTDIFGFMSYDLKNEFENLESQNVDYLQFPQLYFFKPRYLFEIIDNKLTINRNYPETFDLLETINRMLVRDCYEQKEDALTLRHRTTKEQYKQNVESIKQQIAEGDFYELNYCSEFYADQTTINPIDTYLQLSNSAAAPFSTYFKLDDKFLLCSSPERFLKKQDNQLIAQPIKGTVRKGATGAENESLKSQLKNDEKERAENVMIVDLTRNDLAHSSKPGTVRVEELCGLYSFSTVHQLISTVTSEAETDIHFTDIIRHAFPMGSMTGAPKVEVMKNIEKYESFKRSLYSGSVGYITPAADFDFNVVIRSILYNQTEKYVSVRAGGAITIGSDAEKEWQEVLLKTKVMIEALAKCNSIKSV